MFWFLFKNRSISINDVTKELAEVRARCKNCRFFSNNNSKKYIGYIYNVCLRYPQKAPSEYETSPNFWCGEFKDIQGLE